MRIKAIVNMTNIISNKDEIFIAESSSKFNMTNEQFIKQIKKDHEKNFSDRYIINGIQLL